MNKIKINKKTACYQPLNSKLLITIDLKRLVFSGITLTSLINAGSICDKAEKKKCNTLD